MKLADLPVGSEVIVDANILIYSRRLASTQCSTFLERCANREFFGALSTVTVAEFCHRQMMYDAQNHTKLGSNPAKRLAAQPELVKQLSAYGVEVEQLLVSGLQVLPVESKDFLTALSFQKNYGLLTNDSLLLAIAIRCGVRAIATTDAQFETVPGFDIYRPADV
jgi:predicted nucleic acid-binding protein